MATGATPLNEKDTLNATWDVEPPANFYTYIPKPLQAETIRLNIKPKQCDGGACILQLAKTLKSTLPPLLNAMEVFTVIDFPQMETNDNDVAGIKNVQDTYGLSRISWLGDPCVPEEYLWDGLNCDSSNYSMQPTIISLNLSASNLTGNISHAIQNLTHLQKLDLSNDNLTGEIPEFLAHIKSLLVIDVSGKNFTGSVPPSLLHKKGMKLNVDNNPHLLCTADSCVNNGENGHTKKSTVVPVVASIASLAVLIVAIVMFLVLRKKKASKVEEQVAVKILSHSSSQGYKQFKAEVELLLRVHHKNLVSLVGYCDEGDNLALIYEYMANGDLKEHIL
ncbi:unnamed protein product [Brassica oleracea]|uniref:non-specific serine/threonine protein kinase n=1 Tax=Brassica oleracea var. oleracea TaxID=109376 RepID=A0A0D3AJ06_BRAOL